VRGSLRCPSGGIGSRKRPRRICPGWTLAAQWVPRADRDKDRDGHDHSTTVVYKRMTPLRPRLAVFALPPSAAWV
jgi:hypothetical protein